MPLALLYCWLMIGMRGLGVVLLFPTLGGQQLPVILRVALALAMATLLYGLVPHVTVMPLDMLSLVTAAGSELLLGLAMGFVGRLSFAAVELGGRLINQEIGLGGVPGVDTPHPGQEPLASVLTMFAAVLFFLSGAHLGALAAFARSFDFAAAGHAGFGPASLEALIAGTSHVIELGFRIAAPFLALNFLVNLAFSVLGRAVPRMNVFVISFSLHSLVGFALLGTAGTLIARYVWIEFDLLPGRILELLPLPR
jgi:flagellar biosynthesis protein FliR